jgi:hypothetical protein
MARNYKLGIFRRLARYGHPVLKRWEKRQVARHASDEPAHPPVFIVGAPRTGSSLLYQLLSQRLDVLYIDNLAAVFYRDLLFGLWLSRKIYREKSHNCFHSFLGMTEACGLHAPAECGDFWYRWLPREKHYIAEDELPREKQGQIRDILSAAVNRWAKPLLIKNLNAGQRMGMISQIAPGARFIFIKRDPLYTGQSIWLSRQKIGLEPHQWWSIMPKNYPQLVKLNAYRQIAGQIFYLEKQIMEDRRYFPPEHFTTVTYETLCRSPEQTVEQLRFFMGPQVRKRKGNIRLPDLSFREKQKITDHDFHLLKEEIEKYDWENYGLQ